MNYCIINIETNDSLYYLSLHTFQAHMQARYVILRVLLEAGDDLVTISKVTNPEDNQSDLIMSMDRSKIGTVGKKAIGDFLRKLQVWE